MANNGEAGGKPCISMPCSAVRYPSLRSHACARELVWFLSVFSKSSKRTRSRRFVNRDARAANMVPPIKKPSSFTISSPAPIIPTCGFSWKISTIRRTRFGDEQNERSFFRHWPPKSGIWFTMPKRLRFVCNFTIKSYLPSSSSFMTFTNGPTSKPRFSILCNFADGRQERISSIWTSDRFDETVMKTSGPRTERFFAQRASSFQWL